MSVLVKHRHFLDSPHANGARRRSGRKPGARVLHKMTEPSNEKPNNSIINALLHVFLIEYPVIVVAKERKRLDIQ